jgi:hypothetical protein
MCCCLFWASSAQAAPTLAQWLGQSRAEKQQANQVMAKTWDNQDHMIPVVNGQLAELPPYYVPYADLYQLYQDAVDAKDVNFIKLLNQKIVPAAMTLDEILKLLEGPADHDWGKCKRLAEILEVKDSFFNTFNMRAEVYANGELLMPNMYKALGGVLLPTPNPGYAKFTEIRCSNFDHAAFNVENYINDVFGYQLSDFPGTVLDENQQKKYEFCLKMYPDCSKRR